MAGVRLEFAQFGHFDYFNIYRNSVSTVIENLGQPIGTSSTMYYEDLTTEPNQDYYYRVGVIRDSAEMFSEEFHVKTLVEFDPPYDLVIEFRNDETNRLELNWKLDGFVNEQHYYCSETPIDPENLPAPKAVLAGDVRTYVDTVVEVGKTYFVRVGSVRGGVEKISAEKIASTEKLLVFMPLVKDLTDGGSLGIIWKNAGNVTFGENGAYFSSYPQSIFQDSHAFDFNSDYRISFDLMCTSANNTAPSIFNNDETGDFPFGRFSASVGGDNIFAEFKNKWLIGVSGYYDIASDSTVQNDTVYAYSIERRAGVVTVSVNDFVVLSRNETAVISMTTFLNIGRMPKHGQGGQFIGYIRNFKIYDLS